MVLDKDFVSSYAYLPEHIIGYVTTISGAEPHLHNSYLFYVKDDLLIFIGYPLGEPFKMKGMNRSLEDVIREFKSARISLIAPEISLKGFQIKERSSDIYYRLDAENFKIPPKVRNEVKRASRELIVEVKGECSEEHRQLIGEFLNTREISEETKYIFSRIPDYVASSLTSSVINARNSKGRLVAFDVAEFDAKDYAFYMFNFISRKNYIPGASDMLLNILIDISIEKGKRFINLGLGIDKGVTFFKTKWGGIPFLNYEYCFYELNRKLTIEGLFGKL